MKFFNPVRAVEIKGSRFPKSRRSRLAIGLFIVLWLCTAVAGLFVLSRYENVSGVAASPPNKWPANSIIHRAPTGASLVMLIHPHCPCTRATIEELGILMAHSQGRLTAYLLFLKPAGFTEDWEKTDLWDSAARIPGVNNIVDENGAEATRFGAATSGQTIVFNSQGKLLFSGGITPSRGHSGDNAGRSAIESLVNTGSAITMSSSVYGCPLFDNNKDCRVKGNEDGKR